MGHPAGIIERVASARRLDQEHRSVTPPVPRSAKIELTSECDYHCPFCPAETRGHPRGEMSWPLFSRLARRLRDDGVEQLGLFYSGEPFLCEWLPKAIRYAKQECGYPHVFVTSNASRATADRVRECMLAGLDSLKFSLNYDGYREFRNVTGNERRQYDAVLANIEDAHWMREHVEVSTGHRCGLYASSLLYEPDPPRRIPPSLAKILPFVDEHYWLPLYGYGPPPGARGGSRQRDSRIPPGENLPGKPLPCWTLFTAAHITWDGRLSACCFDPAPRFDMGNLETVAFPEAWHGDRFQALRAAHLSGNVAGTACEKCIAY